MRTCPPGTPECPIRALHLTQGRACASVQSGGYRRRKGLPVAADRAGCSLVSRPRCACRWTLRRGRVYVGRGSSWSPAG